MDMLVMYSLESMQTMQWELSVVLFRKPLLLCQKAVSLHCMCSATQLLVRDMGLWSDDQIPGMKRIVDVVHVYGSKMGIQVFLSESLWV